MQITNIEDIIEGSKNLWISAIFYGISGWNQSISLEDQKQAFFYLLEKLLKEGKVRFCPPEDPLCRLGCFWNEKPENIISFLKSEWPLDVENENDLKLNDYFYDIPAIQWLQEDGTWYGS